MSYSGAISDGALNLAKAARARIAARGLGQYVPAAHPEYVAAIRLDYHAGGWSITA